MNCKLYHPEQAAEWNAFVAASRNGTFLIDRRYMDYHSDRFADHSLMWYDDGGRLAAVMPAHVQGDTLCSHRGLTYGGLIMGDRCTTVMACEMMEALNRHLLDVGLRRVTYKPVPHIYHRYPAEEDLYALHAVCHARLTRRDASSALIPTMPVKWNRDRRYAANKARTDGITVAESDAFDVFWHILEDNLMQTYGKTPVHSLTEIQLLKKRFPDEIRLYLARKADGTPLAGTVLYVTPQVAHAQYISGSPEGKHLHAVDALFDHIIRRDFATHRYIDFGISPGDTSYGLHTTLIYQKEGFGGRAVCYDQYEWEVVSGGLNPKP